MRFAGIIKCLKGFYKNGFKPVFRPDKLRERRSQNVAAVPEIGTGLSDTVKSRVR